MFDLEKWQILNNNAPGYLGKKRDLVFLGLNGEHGEGNWEFAWLYQDSGEIVALDFVEACEVYGDAYLIYLKSWPMLADHLCSKAGNVYDDSLENVQSGFDYSLQNGPVTHIQDIAIRRAVAKTGRVFKGQELVQIRDRKGADPLSLALSPGQVPFHRPRLITTPDNLRELYEKLWWIPGSVEDFYQRNRRIIVRK